MNLGQMSETWKNLTAEQREQIINQCLTEGHDYRYIEGTYYRWDCARCNWQETRFRPSLPLSPSADRSRWAIVDQWAVTP